MKTTTNLRTQADMTERVVALANLIAMCNRISGMCHKFEVVKLASHSVHVQYSNPDEYGRNEPVTAVYPAFKNSFDGKDNPFVILHAVRYIGATGRNEESWQAFMQLTDCEPLFRTSSDEWQTRYEILVARMPAWKVTSSWHDGGSIQKWHCNGSDFRSFTDASAYAVAKMTEAQDSAPKQS